VEAVRLVVTGVVQGVGFRWFVRQVARDAGIAGWVRNNSDGSVELVAAGGLPGALPRLEAAVRHGPAGAHVTEVRKLVEQPEAPLPFPFTVLK
jgi:acylphosphatase